MDTYHKVNQGGEHSRYCHWRLDSKPRRRAKGRALRQTQQKPTREIRQSLSQWVELYLNSAPIDR